MPSSPAAMHQSWTSEPKNTARSVLATIFGDTILPVSNSVWLAQLFQMTELFGFSGRLVRTSMYRLAEQGWFTNERVGRQSRYFLTPLAIDESERAANRIYHSPHPDWSGEWTAIFLDAPVLSEETRDNLTQHLRWHGFFTLAAGIIASPTESLDSARELCAKVAPGVHVPSAVLEFSELDDVVADGFFVQALTIEETAKEYREFTSFYEDTDTGACTGPDAFALRTMLIHDLRRIRLSVPDIPAALLPVDWPGTAAHQLATKLYPKLSAAASPWLSDILETNYPEKFPARFS